MGSEAQKARFLETLRTELGVIESGTRGLRDYLGLAALARPLPAEAGTLPLPLYILLSQLSAAQVNSLLPAIKSIAAFVLYRLPLGVALTITSAAASLGITACCHPM